MPFTTCLLGAHISWRSGTAWPSADILLLQREPEINDIWLTLLIQKDISWFNVPMHNPFFMCVMNRLSYRCYKFSNFCRGELAMLQFIRKVSTFDVLGNHITWAFRRHPHIMDGDNTGMV